MKYLSLLLLLSSLSSFAQSNSGCCPVMQSPEDIIPDEKACISSILLNVIELQEYEDFMLEASSEPLSPQDIAQLTNELRSCNALQRVLVANIRESIRHARELTGNDEVKNLSDVITVLAVHLNVDLSTNVVANDLTPSQGKSTGCQDGSGNCVKKSAPVASKKVTELVAKLEQIQENHAVVASACREYVVNSEEQALIDQIKLLVTTSRANQSQ